MDFRTILYDTRDHIAKIIINRPERMNGYTETMVKEMVAAGGPAPPRPGPRPRP